MDNSKKCSHKKHSEKEAVTFCKECKKYWCNKCTNDHPDYFEDHHLLDLKKENQDLFTGLCSLENHNQELKYYCKNHNQLCCAACISKIKGNGDGQHSECDVCHIKDIHDEKKSTLENNIKILEDYSKSIDSSLDELKNIFKTMIKDKDELKKKIYQLFTKIRTALNEREDEICKIIDNKFDSLYFKEDFINQGNKLPNEIKQSLEKGKSLNNENNVLNKFINNCIIIENNIKKIQIIKENIEKCNKKGIKIHFFPEKEDEINKFIDKIKSFGEIKEFIFGGEEEDEEEEKEEDK